MKKDFLKSVVLTGLVISSLVLSVNIWYEKELWSLDYSSFVYSLKNFFQKNEGGKFADTDELLYFCEYTPEFISFTYASQKSVIYSASPDFEEANLAVADIISSIKKEGTLVSITDEEYVNTYKTNSVMLKFSSDINLLTFLKQEDAFFDGIRDYSSSIVVIGIDESQTNYLSFKDSQTGHAYRMSVKTKADVKKIQTDIQAAQQNASFAFELNFDEPKDDTRRILFQRFVPIVIGNTEVRDLKIEPLQYSSDYDSVFKAFGIVKNSARIYRDRENTIHFIENRCTLKIPESGGFRFEATEREAGIPLTGDHEKEAVLEFANLLYQNIAPDSQAFLCIDSIVIQGNKTWYELIYRTKNGDVYSFERPAVSIMVESGSIVDYDQVLWQIFLEGGSTAASGVIDAYDSLYKQTDNFPKTDVTIRSMFPAHIVKEEQLALGWVCRFSDDSGSYLIP